MPEIAVRTTFRHGNLRKALLDAAVEMARTGGPQAIVLREAARQAGVAPNAAYRHFAGHGDLLRAVRTVALDKVALEMHKELAKVRKKSGMQEFARASVRAIGTAYLRFARAEPGFFRTAFCHIVATENDDFGQDETASGLHPFTLLGLALDRMVEAELLDPERRPGAEFLAWSAVHGLAMLAMDGPLRGVGKKDMLKLEKRVLAMVEDGI